MRRVMVICVGRMKERFYAGAAAEYIKRLSRYCKLEIVELPEDNSMRVEDGETHKYIYRFGLKTERNECAEGRS